MALEPSMFDQDMPSRTEVTNLVAWLVQAGYEVDVEVSVRCFVDVQVKREGTVVFPLWRGGASRNRTAIVPAVCESRGLLYVGGDALVQTACQDKSLGKAFVRAAGMPIPKEWVIRSMDDLPKFSPSKTLPPPFVVKPLYSACSIGVDDNSLCMSDDEARRRAEELFVCGFGPVICEEFIAGDEVSLCLLEERGRIAARCIAVFRDANGKCSFRNGLFTYAAKTSLNPDWSIAQYPEPLDERIWRSAEALIRTLGKVDLLRIDGRLRDGRFTVIELTPDIHMGTDSAFLGGFAAAGYTPETMLDRLIQTSIRNQMRLE
jgi:D-alanine-D-alanine ligase